MAEPFGEGQSEPWGDGEAFGLERPPSVRPGPWRIGPRDSATWRGIHAVPRPSRGETAAYRELQRRDALGWSGRRLEDLAQLARRDRRRVVRLEPRPWPMLLVLVLVAVVIARPAALLWLAGIPLGIAAFVAVWVGWRPSAFEWLGLAAALFLLSRLLATRRRRRVPR